MSLWYWQENVLRCALLDQWPHGFFTCQHTHPPQRLHYYLSDRGQAFQIRQVHGNICLAVDDITDSFGKIIPEADGLWTQPSDQIRSVWVCSADCVPVLIGDCTHGAVAAVHAGWRGTAAGIVPIIVQHLRDRGCRLTDLRIALGPAISGTAYQVGQEVADRVTSTIQVPVGISADGEAGRYRLDIRLVQQQQLLELGIFSQHIAIAPYCTLASPDLFFSYRRHTLANRSGSPGVQWSGIVAAHSNITFPTIGTT